MLTMLIVLGPPTPVFQMLMQMLPRSLLMLMLPRPLLPCQSRALSCQTSSYAQVCQENFIQISHHQCHPASSSSLSLSYLTLSHCKGDQQLILAASLDPLTFIKELPITLTSPALPML